MQRVAIYTHRPLINSALTKTLKPFYSISEAACKEEDIRAKLPNTKLDVVIIGTDGYFCWENSILDYIHTNHPQLRILVIGEHLRHWQLRQMVEHSVDGIASEMAGDRDILRAVNDLLHGRKYISKDLQPMVQDIRRSLKDGTALSLTPNEIQLLMDCREGLSSIEIGEKHGKSKKTIENQKAALFDKLDCSNTIELIRRATELGFIP